MDSVPSKMRNCTVLPDHLCSGISFLAHLQHFQIWYRIYIV